MEIEIKAGVNLILKLIQEPLVATSVPVKALRIPSSSTNQSREASKARSMALLFFLFGESLGESNPWDLFFFFPPSGLKTCLSFVLSSLLSCFGMLRQLQIHLHDLWITEKT